MSCWEQSVPGQAREGCLFNYSDILQKASTFNTTLIEL